MSEKLVIETVKNSILSALKVVERDMMELGQLQSAQIGKTRDFALSSYNACLKKISSALQKNISSLYDIEIPSYIPFSDKKGCYSKTDTSVYLRDIVNKSKMDAEDIENSYENLGSFLVNPISGLNALLRGFPFVTMSVGVKMKNSDGNNVMSQAVVYDLSTNSFYTASSKGGSFISHNFDMRMKQSNVQDLDCATVFVLGWQEIALQLENYTEKNRRIVNRIRNLPFLVSNFLSIPNYELAIISVASGKSDACFVIGDFDTRSIETAVFIAQEAGCEIFDLKGNTIFSDELSKSQEGFIVSSRKMKQQIMEKILS